MGKGPVMVAFAHIYVTLVLICRNTISLFYPQDKSMRKVCLKVKRKITEVKRKKTPMRMMDQTLEENLQQRQIYSVANSWSRFSAVTNDTPPSPSLLGSPATPMWARAPPSTSCWLLKKCASLRPLAKPSTFKHWSWRMM